MICDSEKSLLGVIFHGKMFKRSVLGAAVALAAVSGSANAAIELAGDAVQLYGQAAGFMHFTNQKLRVKMAQLKQLSNHALVSVAVLLTTKSVLTSFGRSKAVTLTTQTRAVNLVRVTPTWVLTLTA